jgi:hypothetical protein
MWRAQIANFLIVMPAKAGVQGHQLVGRFWTPAFAGVTPGGRRQQQRRRYTQPPSTM